MSSSEEHHGEEKSENGDGLEDVEESKLTHGDWSVQPGWVVIWVWVWSVAINLFGLVPWVWVRMWVWVSSAVMKDSLGDVSGVQDGMGEGKGC